MNALQHYLRSADRSLQSFAEEIGVTPEAVRRYAAGERFPRPDIIARIKDATNGAVTADDFLPAPRPATMEAGQ